MHIATTIANEILCHDHSAVNLQMLALANAQERTIEDWTALLAQADPRLEIISVNRPPGSYPSIIEVTIKA